MALNWLPRRMRACRGVDPLGCLHPFRVNPGIISNALRMPLRASRLAPGGGSEERRQGMSLLNLKWVIAALLVLVSPSLGWAGQAQPATSPFKGEYFCTRNADPICVPFTKNLNQFRRLDFDVCHPRLSEKYPQFTRPEWAEIPFDLPLVETIVKNPYGDQGGAVWWQAWLKASEPLRAQGKLKLWRTQIDVDGDGAPETIVRLGNPFATKVWQGQEGWVMEENPCGYRHGRLYMLDTSHDFMKVEFNRAASDIADIVHFSEGQVFPGEVNRYFGISRLTIPAYPDGELIGATRGMLLYRLSKWGGGNVCSINWVPTGAYRPIQRSRTPR